MSLALPTPIRNGKKPFCAPVVVVDPTFHTIAVGECDVSTPTNVLAGFGRELVVAFVAVEFGEQDVVTGRLIHATEDLRLRGVVEHCTGVVAEVVEDSRQRAFFDEVETGENFAQMVWSVLRDEGSVEEEMVGHGDL